MRIAAAVSSLFLGLGFGIPGLLGMLHLYRTGEVWTFLGFPTYGGGPFERIGLPTTIWLLAGFLAVCVAELIVAVLIWLNAPYATALSFVLLPFELVFWLGFALPLGPLLGAARSVFVLLA
jgi:hypothetical protein